MPEKVLMDWEKTAIDYFNKALDALRRGDAHEARRLAKKIEQMNKMDSYRKQVGGERGFIWTQIYYLYGMAHEREGNIQDAARQLQIGRSLGDEYCTQTIKDLKKCYPDDPIWKTISV